MFSRDDRRYDKVQHGYKCLMGICCILNHDNCSGHINRDLDLDVREETQSKYYSGTQIMAPSGFDPGAHN